MGDSNLNVQVERQPCMLFEAAELLYAYVNDLPASALTMEGEFCLTEREIAQWMKQICSGLDPQDELIRHYFAEHELLDNSGQRSCAAFLMLYSFMQATRPDPQAHMEALCEQWEQIRRGCYRVGGMNRYGIDISQEGSSYTTLSRELRRLPISEEFFLLLLEVFSDYTYELHRMWTLMQPVAEKLQALLVPAVERAQRLQEQWKCFFSDEANLVELLNRRGGTITWEPVCAAEFFLRYLDARHAPGVVSNGPHHVWMHLGVGIYVTALPAYQQRQLNAHEFTAFRLLGDESRSRIVRALMKRPMAMQEVANQLNMNPGVAFRNLNSLTNSEVLTKTVQSGRYFYQTNIEYIRVLFQHVIKYYEEGLL